MPKSGNRPIFNSLQFQADTANLLKSVEPSGTRGNVTATILSTFSEYFLRFSGDARREPALAGGVRDAGGDGRGGEARNRRGE